MRIAITGAHGVGKSTLALMLATELQLPLIEEIARVVAEKMGYASTQEIVKANTIDRQRFQEAVLSCQINTEFRYYARGFVADRSVLDVAAYAAWYKIRKPEIWAKMPWNTPEGITICCFISRWAICRRRTTGSG